DLLRGRQAAPVLAALRAAIVRDDVVADVDALVADEDGRPGDQLADVVLVLVAERAAQDLPLGAGLLRCGHFSRREITWSTMPYSLACSASMMKSRSESATIFSSGCWVWLARIWLMR